MERFSLTADITLRPRASIVPRESCSAVNTNEGPVEDATLAQFVASCPSTAAARPRHSALSSARDRTSFAGRVERVA